MLMTLHAGKPAKGSSLALVRRVCLVMLMAHCGTLLLAAAPPPRYAEFDRRIVAELQARNPEAAALFTQANQARDRGDQKTAGALYERVRQLEPTFFHATRRLCGVESNLDNRPRAVALCREALAAEKTTENLAALAAAIANGTKASQPTEADWNEARELTQKAIELDRTNATAYRVSAQIALQRNNFAGLKDATSHLEVLEPNEVSTAYFQIIVALSEGKYSKASQAVDRAASLGLSAASVKELRTMVQSAKPWPLRALPIAAVSLGAWLGGFLILFVAGLILSRVALRAASKMPSETSGRAHGMNLKVLRLYAGVLRTCCLFYYASIPLLLLTVLGVGGGLIYTAFAIGHIPIKLIIIIFVVGGTSIVSVLRSLFVRVKHAEPGLPLDLSPHPRLRAALDEVASRIGTRPVDNVYLVPDNTVAVMERGSMLKQIGGHPERCLILGAGALDGMRLRAFKAILAHEYGHFSNRDTNPGALSLKVTHSLQEMGDGLARGGAATWFNPAWLFVNAFHRVFLRISLGASRLQEALADRWAAFNYGSASFEEGLTQIVAGGVRLNARLNATVREAVQARVAVSNFYSHHPETPAPEKEIETKIRESLERAPSPYDSHPSPAQRFVWVRALAATGAAVSLDDGAEAWSLVSDRSRIELLMSRQICENLSNFHGIDLPAPEPSPAG